MNKLPTILVLCTLLTSFSALSADRILLKFTPQGKKEFISGNIVSAKDFKGNTIEVGEENSIDLMNIEVQRKNLPQKCYDGDTKVVEKILQKMVANSEAKHSRPIVEKKYDLYGKMMMASLTEKPEGCGAGVAPCWNMAITIEPCKK